MTALFRIVALALCLFGGGCAEVRLDTGTDDLSRSLSNLYVRQALNNFSRLIDDEHAIPSQVDITAGTVQTVDNVTPSLTIPLSSQIVDTVTGATRMHGRTMAGFGGSIGAAASTQDNWNLLPVSDANALRNLRALYRWALFGEDLGRDYNPYEIVVDGKFYLDPYHLRMPRCVLCYGGKDQLISDKRLLRINPTLHPRFIYWSNPAGDAGRPNLVPEGVAFVNLGHFGNRDLYMTEKDYRQGVLDDFVLFIMPYGQITATYAVAGNDKDMAKRKAAGGDGRKTGLVPSKPTTSSSDARPSPSAGRWLFTPPSTYAPGSRGSSPQFMLPSVGIQPSPMP